MPSSSKKKAAFTECTPISDQARVTRIRRRFGLWKKSRSELGGDVCGKHTPHVRIFIHTRPRVAIQPHQDSEFEDLVRSIANQHSTTPILRTRIRNRVEYVLPFAPLAT